MKAKVKLSAKVGGVQYNVSAGEVIPPALAEFYAANKAIESLVKTGAIELDEQVSEPIENLPSEPTIAKQVRRDTTTMRTKD